MTTPRFPKLLDPPAPVNPGPCGPGIVDPPTLLEPYRRRSPADEEAAIEIARNKRAPVIMPCEPEPLAMILHCPNCGTQHIDTPDPAVGWTNPPHRSHLCLNPGCGTIWRPADVATEGVAEIRTRGKSDTWPYDYDADAQGEIDIAKTGSI